MEYQAYRDVHVFRSILSNLVKTLEPYESRQAWLLEHGKYGVLEYIFDEFRKHDEDIVESWYD